MCLRAHVKVIRKKIQSLKESMHTVESTMTFSRLREIIEQVYKGQSLKEILTEEDLSQIKDDPDLMFILLVNARLSRSQWSAINKLHHAQNQANKRQSRSDTIKSKWNSFRRI